MARRLSSLAVILQAATASDGRLLEVLIKEHDALLGAETAEEDYEIVAENVTQ